MSDTMSKSWFITFNHPEEHGYTGTPEEILNKMRDEFIGDSETRSGAWAYCISAAGLHHVHMVLEDVKNMRFTAIKKIYGSAHIEETKGSRKQAEDYIQKRGAFAEKGETVEFLVRHGEIKGRQGQRRDLADIYKRLETGETPQDIIEESPKEYLHLDVIKKMYFDIRSKNTPIQRQMRVFWHTGRSGSGKSYSRLRLAELHGEDNIYYLTAFNTGAFDRYNGEPILWIEDFRGEFKLQELLRLLDVYKAEIPSRYSNGKALWTEVHITSVLTPQQCYATACKDEYDRIEQLERRLTSIVYHFKGKDNCYYQLDFPPKTQLNYMIKKSEEFLSFANEFIPIDTLYDDVSPDNKSAVGVSASADTPRAPGEENATK